MLFLRADGTNTVPSVAEDSSSRSPAYCVRVVIHRPEIAGQREKRRKLLRLFPNAAPSITASITGLNHK